EMRSKVVGMEHWRPTHVTRVLAREVCIIQQPLVAEIVGAVGQAGPNLCRNRVDGGAQFLFGLLTPPFSAFAVLNIDERPVPSSDFSVLVAQRRRAKQEPAIVAIRSPQARFSLTGFTQRGDGAPRFDRAAYVFGMDCLNPSPLTRSFLR